MNTKENLNQALQNAMRSGDSNIKNTVRLVLSSIKLLEVEKCTSLDESSVIAIVQKEIKTRLEVIEDAKKINREDIIESNKSEIQILSSFLPEQLSEQEVESLAAQVISETGATSVSEMGKVMKELLPKLQGKASNNVISNMVRKLLSSQ